LFVPPWFVRISPPESPLAAVWWRSTIPETNPLAKSPWQFAQFAGAALSAVSLQRRAHAPLSPWQLASVPPPAAALGAHVGAAASTYPTSASIVIAVFPPTPIVAFHAPSMCALEGLLVWHVWQFPVPAFPSSKLASCGFCEIIAAEPVPCRPLTGFTALVEVSVWQAVHPSGPAPPHCALPVAWQPRSPVGAEPQVLLVSFQLIPTRSIAASSCTAVAPSISVVLTVMCTVSAMAPWQELQTFCLSKCLLCVAVEICPVPVLPALVGLAA
jgi:hypothetical protein